MGARPKLTFEQVQEIRAKVRKRKKLQAELASLSDRAMAKEYNVNASTICDVTLYRTYRYVPDPPYDDD